MNENTITEGSAMLEPNPSEGGSITPRPAKDKQPYYQIHMFMCVNHRDNARSCAGSNSVALHEYLKKKAREAGLEPLRTLRVNKSGCMGRCEHGPTAVIYPLGVWYHYETREDLDEILHEHLLNGRIVERLRIPTPPLDG